MAHDLLAPEELPEGRSYKDGAIRLATSFDIAAARIEEDGVERQSVLIQPWSCLPAIAG